ncbi:MAG: hypothetical protein OSB41_10600 [Kiritimatiellae bacterium]|nr:hypothetical protein [Kiritimatiellia bacterium]
MLGGVYVSRVPPTHGNTGGALIVAEKLRLDDSAQVLTRALDTSLLNHLNSRVMDFLTIGSTQEMRWRIHADVRALMEPTWHRWKRALDADPATLCRFLRLTAASNDSPPPDHEAGTIAGPQYAGNPAVRKTNP